MFRWLKITELEKNQYKQENFGTHSLLTSGKFQIKNEKNPIRRFLNPHISGRAGAFDSPLHCFHKFTSIWTANALFHFSILAGDLHRILYSFTFYFILFFSYIAFFLVVYQYFLFICTIFLRFFFVYPRTKQKNKLRWVEIKER
jgi:hypothetical protein